ncbi:MAG: tetratricopeptide repeat protein [Fibrobacter sp.]|nr:tetratricopeptide repeat protein [Fibrobacter sp.]
MQRTHQIVCIAFVVLLSSSLYGQRQLIYDPERGIIFDDEPRGTSAVSQDQSSSDQIAETRPKRNSNDLHFNRKKDPPELYFRSGLEYFKNRDYKSALKNFSYADSVTGKPQYLLWKGKTFRQLGDTVKMLSIMEEIYKKHRTSEVADDALFELALYYQSNDDYAKATEVYTSLIEQFPMSTSFSTGEELREVAREQRRLMRAEIMNLLGGLGFMEDELTASISKFQKANHLKVTGTGNKETISAIRKNHKDISDKETIKAQDEAMTFKFSKWNITALAMAVFNILMLFLISRKIKKGRQHLENLNGILKDLDINKL